MNEPSASAAPEPRGGSNPPASAEGETPYQTFDPETPSTEAPAPEAAPEAAATAVPDGPQPASDLTAAEIAANQAEVARAAAEVPPWKPETAGTPAPTATSTSVPAPVPPAPVTPPAPPVWAQSPEWSRPAPPPVTGPSSHPLTAQIPPVWAAAPTPPPGVSYGPAPTPGYYPNSPVTGYPAPAPKTPAWRKPLAAVALIAALVIGSATAGGVAGYIAGDNNAAASDTHISSPSAPVANGTTIADVAAAVQPSVVVISTGQAEGSGVVLDKNGNILTNNHVVATARGNTVAVKFADGTTANARIVGTDPSNDLAVINVGASDKLTPIAIGDSGGLRVGDTVLALGSPLGLEGSVSSGIVSALNRTISVGSEQENPFGRPEATELNGLIQTDAAINSGNSGGALVNGRGELIGINTAIATDGSSSGSIGVGFAIPSNTAKQVAEKLIAQGS